MKARLDAAEAELDKARAECARWQEVHKSDTGCDLHLIRALKAERDEALAQSERAVTEAEEWERLYEQMKAERDQARKASWDWQLQFSGAYEERLEARAWARKLYRQCKAANNVIHNADDLDNERFFRRLEAFEAVQVITDD